MPGPWYGPSEDQEFFENFPLEKGGLYEVRVYDDDENEQGTCLVEISRRAAYSARGVWFTGKPIAASDEYFDWWCVEKRHGEKKGFPA